MQNKIGYYAGMATKQDGSRLLVAAGGRADPEDPLTWIYELDSGIDLWRPGVDLPLTFGDTIQYLDNTFLVVGGQQNFSPFGDVDEIWEFEPESENWIRRPETLKSAKNSMAVFLVPDDYATC